MFNVYAHLYDNKVVYIGVGTNKRVSVFKQQKPTYSIKWNEYFFNKKPILKILNQFSTRDEAELFEWLAIREFNPILNVKDGGRHGRYFYKIKKSNKMKLANKIAQIGKPRRTVGQAHGMWGKKHSAHSIIQNAISNGVNPYYAIKLDCGVVFGPFYTKTQAANELNIPASPNIGSCLSGKLKSYKGYAFIKEQNHVQSIC